MCGIAGIWSANPSLAVGERVEEMASRLVHRGPDNHGVWMDEERHLAIAHRRLSILDLSPHGHQPMCSVSGRYVIAFNGEIYNFATLREDITAAGGETRWRGHSDTEILLAAIDLWGLEAVLERAVGMFAIALWDRAEHVLTLARDRIGEKPLYYGTIGGCFLFASELKALCAAVGPDLAIDRDALAEFMRFGYIPAPRSIYRGIAKLLPGYFVRIRRPGAAEAPRRFWAIDDADRTGERLAGCGDRELVDLVHDRIRDAVGLQMGSDVPLGAFLSGGVDSSLVVSLMQAQSSRPVRTFTIGFQEKMFNEAPFAKAVAEHLGTDHTEMYVSARDAAALIPELPEIYDEPFADSSQIPTALVSRLTRQHVTVSLSGDGGDELFAGYPRYPITAALWSRVERIPLAVRRAGASVLRVLSAQAWDRLLAPLPSHQRARINGRRIHRLAQLMLTHSLGEMYVRLMSQWQPEDSLVLEGAAESFEGLSWPAVSDPVEAMRRWDVQQYLPDDLLVKVDRASMYASLESRAPLLDHRVVELAFMLPTRVLVRDGVGKWVLRRVLDRYVPNALIERPKAGFSVPLGDWLRGPLRGWASDLLDPSRLRADSYLDATKVSRMWEQHLSGRFDRSLSLWNVLMFQAWLGSSRTISGMGARARSEAIVR